MTTVERINELEDLETGTMFDLLNSDIPNIEYLIDNILPKGMITIIFGQGESFKTGFSLYLALCLATGKDTFLYKTNKKSKVLWIDEEMGITGLKQKVSRLSKGLGINYEEFKDSFIYKSITGFKLDDENTYEMLEQEIIQQKIDVIFIDSIARTMLGDENSVKDVRKIHDVIRKLISKTGVTFITIHHITKSSNGLNLQSLRGSGDFGNQVDMALGMRCVGKDKFLLGRYKWRYKEEEIEKINFQVNDIENGMKLEYLGTARENLTKTKQLEEDLRECLDHPMKWSEIVNLLEKKGHKKGSIEPKISKWKKENKIKKSGDFYTMKET